MSLVVIILSFILLSDIHGLYTDESTGVDVLLTLKSKNSSCDLHHFVKSTENYNTEYKMLTDDLMKHCTNSEWTKKYRILCRMILIELEIGCSLSDKSAPSPIKYTIPYTSTQICSMDKIALTNNWIWKKLTSNERKQLGSKPSGVCPKITSSGETLRLARFFYKIAPRIRRADSASADRGADTILAGKEEANKTIVDKIKQSGKLLVNKTVLNLQLIKPIVGGILRNTANKTLAVLDLKKDINAPGKQVEGESAIDKENNDIKVGQRNDKDDEHLLENKGAHPESHDESADENKEHIINSADVKQRLENQKKDLKQIAEEKEQDESKNVDAIEVKPAIVLKKNEGGLPLGRAGERPERERVNERPKPKALDVNSVYKSADREERNWVEGKDIDPHRDNALHINPNHIRRMKFEEHPSGVGQGSKRKPSLRSRLSRLNNGNDGWSGNFITYVLIFTLGIVIFYLVIHNKNKVLGLILEGCRRKRTIYNRRLGAQSSVPRHVRLSQSI